MYSKALASTPYAFCSWQNFFAFFFNSKRFNFGKKQEAIRLSPTQTVSIMFTSGQLFRANLLVGSFHAGRDSSSGCSALQKMKPLPVTSLIEVTVQFVCLQKRQSRLLVSALFTFFCHNRKENLVVRVCCSVPRTLKCVKGIQLIYLLTTK